MALNINIVLRVFLFSIFICFSLIFFYFGFIELNTSNYVKSLNNLKYQKEITISEDKNEDYGVVQLFFQKDFNSPKNNENEIILTVKKNDTFDELIKPYIKNNQIKQKIINLITSEYNLKKLNIGKKIFLYTLNENINADVIRIIIPINFNTDLVIKKNNSGSFIINKETVPIQLEKVSKKYTITKSVFKDGQQAGVPLSILAEIIRLYSFDIDFQRDIQKGNKLEVMYKVLYNAQRNNKSYGDIEYVNLTFNKNNLEYFFFKTSEGFIDYFNREGKNVRKALMKTPLDGARISSNFGNRKHPILGYNKLHRGVDFAAPTGTPVYAAGNGVIEYANRNGGYGKYIRIRHNSSYKTAYAHLNSFKKGISKGIRVNQGQIIGYVGSTGRSTGPHLHYEVIYQGKAINPMKMKLPSGKILEGKELIKFTELSKTIYSDFLFHLFE